MKMSNNQSMNQNCSNQAMNGGGYMGNYSQNNMMAGNNFNMMGGGGNPMMGGGNPMMVGCNPMMGGGNPMMGGGNPMMSGGNPMMSGGNPMMGGGNPMMGGYGMNQPYNMNGPMMCQQPGYMSQGMYSGMVNSYSANQPQVVPSQQPAPLPDKPPDMPDQPPPPAPVEPPPASEKNKTSPQSSEKAVTSGSNESSNQSKQDASTESSELTSKAGNVTKSQQSITFSKSEEVAPDWNKNSGENPREALKRYQDQLEKLQKQGEVFEEQYNDWQKQFDEWKAKHQNHPNKAKFKQYESQWSTWRDQMLTQKKTNEVNKERLLTNIEKIKDAIEEENKFQQQAQQQYSMHQQFPQSAYQQSSYGVMGGFSSPYNSTAPNMPGGNFHNGSQSLPIGPDGNHYQNRMPFANQQNFGYPNSNNHPPQMPYDNGNQQRMLGPNCNQNFQHPNNAMFNNNRPSNQAGASNQVRNQQPTNMLNQNQQGLQNQPWQHYQNHQSWRPDGNQQPPEQYFNNQQQPASLNDQGPSSIVQTQAQPEMSNNDFHQPNTNQLRPRMPNDNQPRQNMFNNNHQPFGNRMQNHSNVPFSGDSNLSTNVSNSPAFFNNRKRSQNHEDEPKKPRMHFHGDGQITDNFGHDSSQTELQQSSWPRNQQPRQGFPRIRCPGPISPIHRSPILRNRHPHPNFFPNRMPRPRFQRFPHPRNNYNEQSNFHTSSSQLGDGFNRQEIDGDFQQSDETLIENPNRHLLNNDHNFAEEVNEKFNDNEKVQSLPKTVDNQSCRKLDKNNEVSQPDSPSSMEKSDHQPLLKNCGVSGYENEHFPSKQHDKDQHQYDSSDNFSRTVDPWDNSTISPSNKKKETYSQGLLPIRGDESKFSPVRDSYSFHDSTQIDEFTVAGKGNNRRQDVMPKKSTHFHDGNHKVPRMFGEAEEKYDEEQDYMGNKDRNWKEDFKDDYPSTDSKHRFLTRPPGVRPQRPQKIYNEQGIEMSTLRHRVPPRPRFRSRAPGLPHQRFNNNHPPRIFMDAKRFPHGAPIRPSHPRLRAPRPMAHRGLNPRFRFRNNNRPR